jgi:hypothetical protein
MARRQEAIAEAVRQRVISGLSFGSLREGQRLPSARVLAREFRADPRSVVAALRRLEAEGLLVRRPPSRAYYVARRPGVGKITGPGEAWLTEVLLGALSRGVPVPQFAEYVHRAVATLRLRAVCLECNRDQQQWLCRELHESFGLEAAPLELAQAEDQAADLHRADLLVTTSAHADEVRTLAERFGKPCIVASLRQDLSDEIRRLLSAGPLYFVGTDRRFAEKLRRDFEGVPGADNLRTVVLGEDDPAAIPAGAPAYVMRTAREELGGPPAQVRALATLRAFSTQTAHAILSFVVQENVRAAAARGVTGSMSGPHAGAAA